LPIARVRRIAEGHVWAGSAARQIGLVDAFGTVDDAIAAAAKLAKIDPADARPLYIERPLNPWKQFLKSTIAPDRDADTDTDAAMRDPWSRIAARPDRLVARALADARSVLMGPAIQVRCLECPSSDPVPSQRDISVAQSLIGWLAR
jgi:protease-4